MHPICPDRRCATIATTGSFPGIAGEITLDEKRNPVKPAFVVQISGGKLKYVATVKP